jgi:small-conductance mechanosensitive channel
MFDKLPEQLNNLFVFHGIEIALTLGATWLAGVALDWLGRRRLQHRGQRAQGWVRWLPLLRVGVWVTGLGLLAGLMLEVGVQEFILLAVPVVLALGLAARDLLGNLLGGIVLALDRRFHLGDVIRVGDQEGEVRNIGIRSVQLATKDGHIVELPNLRFLREPYSNITPDVSDIQTRIVMVLPAETQVARAREIAYLAAAVSRYASPRKAPEVFIDTHFDQTFLLRLTILGYVFDPAFEEHYRSDVVESVRDNLHIRPGLDEDPSPSLLLTSN